MRGWALLVLSSLLQVGWIESLHRTEGFRRPVPLVWYALFGLSSTYCLSRALQTIPVGTAYAAWTGLSMIGCVVLDVALARQSLNPSQTLCVLAVLGGTAGLRIFTSAG
jgi:quaternary ammonium compound-resistance protein SugE